MSARIRYTIPVLILFLSLFLSCRNGQKETNTASGNCMKYARYIQITEEDGHYNVRLSNPWDSTKILHQYTLIRKGSSVPENNEGEIIEIPIDRIAVFSSVHAAILESLGAEDRITGICEPEYLTSEHLKRLVKENRITDLGPAATPDIEKILDIDTRFIITSPLENSSIGGLDKTGLPIIEGIDYMENTPLGRSEWIKFFALLIGKENVADSIFNKVETRYMELKNRTAQLENRPSLMTDTKYGNTWYISGNDSYMVNMYKDAGATYLFDEITGSGSKPMNFEYVMDKAINADYWIIKYYNRKYMSYDDLEKEYPLYSRFSPFINRKIYACNTAYSRYYDDIIIHPEYILEDLIKIFHPELTADTTLFKNRKQHYFMSLGL